VTKEIASFIKKDNVSSYTSHAIRRSAATALVDNGASDAQLRKAGRWRSMKAAKEYDDNSKKSKVEIASILQKEKTPNDNTKDEQAPTIPQQISPNKNEEPSTIPEQTSEPPPKKQKKSLLLTNCTFSGNVNFNL